MEKVTAQLADGTRKVEVQYAFGANLKEMTSLFGDDVVFNRAHASLVIDLQALVRRNIKAGKTDKEILEAVKGWAPEVRSTERRSAEEKADDLLGKLSPEQRAALLKKYKS